MLAPRQKYLTLLGTCSCCYGVSSNNCGFFQLSRHANFQLAES